MEDTKLLTDRENVVLVAGAVLLLWFGAVLLLGVDEVFVRPPGALPLPILAGVFLPIAVFLVAYFAIEPFRGFVLSLDLPVVTAIQAWRFGGLGFLALYAYDILPALFAWPAGLGDMLIGITAPWVMLALINRPAFAATRLFLVWNLMGVLDLVVAVSLGGLSSVLGIGITGEITTSPMARMPLVFIPAFLVPLFIMLHLTSLFQAHRMKVAGKVCGWTGSPVQCGPMGTAAR